MKPAAESPNERGFALLLVFLMAAMIAITLYQAMPRVAFESQREKEQLLIDRGKQYVRAIQLYYVAYKKYPSKIEDLENTNNHRYLRRRYIDPMTGKDEWRLIHVNGAGQLTDSLVQKPPTPAGASGASGASGTSGTGGSSATGASSGNGTDPNTPPQVNAAVLRRPSDVTLLPSGTSGASPNPNDPDDPKNWPPIALVPAGGQNGQVPGQAGQLPGQVAGQFPGQPANGGLPNGYQPGLPGQVPGSPQSPNGLPLPGQIPGGVPTQANGQPGFVTPNQFQPQTGTGAPPTTNAAVGMIMSSLTTPRQPSTDSNFGSGSMGAAGLAGVASTFKGPSIKIYKDHQKYQEWEFIFDLKQGLPGQQTTGTQTGAQPGQGLQTGAQSGQPSSGLGLTFGQSSTGTQTGAPQPPPSQPPPQPPQN